MNKAKRRVVIAGNWKMNKNRAEAKALITELLPLVKEAGCEVVICTPYTNLETALALTEGSNVKVGAENCHWAESGAFTGEISSLSRTSRYGPSAPARRRPTSRPMRSTI